MNIKHDTCSICLQNMNSYMQNVDYPGDYRICNLNCGHQFHCKCIFDLIMSNKTLLYDYYGNCPLCRVPIVTIMVHSRYDLNTFIKAKINYEINKASVTLLCNKKHKYKYKYKYFAGFSIFLILLLKYALYK